MSAVPKTRSRIVLGPELNGTLMTPEEFDDVEEYDENYVYELIHGVLIVNPIPLERKPVRTSTIGELPPGHPQRDLQTSALDVTLPELYVRRRTAAAGLIA